MAKASIFKPQRKAVEDVLSPDRESSGWAFNACAFRILKEPDIRPDSRRRFESWSVEVDPRAARPS